MRLGASVQRRRPPRAVSFVATLLLVEAVVVVLAGATMATLQLASLPTPEAASTQVGPLMTIAPGLGLACIVVVAGGGLALASVGLVRLRPWAWVLAMALQGLGLANALYETAAGQPQFIALAVGSFVVLVLNQREVRQAFDLRHHHA